MKTAPFGEILKIVQETNILPIISSCNIKCKFCSHKNNPEEIETYILPKLDIEEIEELIEYLSTDRKIVIGESASRIVEGEPFLHKNFMYILKRIREKYKVTLIQITTNGSYLTEEVIKDLSLLNPIEINISLNSSNEENREKLICDKKPETSIQGCKLLNEYGIKYNGSLVVRPDIVGWDDIKNTIAYLCKNGAELVKVFIPGVTKHCKEELDFDELYLQTINIVKQIRKQFDTPIVVEPPVIDSLDAVVEGTIKNSPAKLSGLKYGDIIKKVDGQAVKSRVDAYNKCFEAQNPSIEFEREGTFKRAELVKNKGISAGFVVSYDIDPKIKGLIEKAVYSRKAKKPVIITSEFGYKPLGLLLKDMEYNILPVVNNYFGGSIKCTGLLTVDDIVEQIRELDYNPDLIVLPSLPFDMSGRDLKNTSYFKIQETIGVPVEII